jgi:hypothetical protein
MALGYVVAICSERRFNQLPKRSAYVIAGDERGQLVSSCGTGLYGILFKQYYNYPRDYSHMLQRNTVRYDFRLGTVPYRAVFCCILRQGKVLGTIVWRY